MAKAPKKTEPAARSSATSPGRPTRRQTSGCWSSANIVLDGPYNPPAARASRDAPADHGPHARSAAARGRPRDHRAVRRAGPSAGRSSPRRSTGCSRSTTRPRRRATGSRTASRLALEGVLVWPHFLFRVELDPPGAAPGTSYPISEYELASRLSYFLWSSMPDDELFALAAQGRLRREPRSPGAADARRPEVGGLRAELRRPVADDSGSWPTSPPTPRRSPASTRSCGRRWPARPSCSSRRSSARTAASSTCSTPTSASSTSGWRSTTASTGVTGPEFRRVKLPPNRGGILTQASILTLTSNPTRTSPVQAGQVGAGADPRHAAAARRRPTCPRCPTAEAARPARSARSWSSTARTRVCASCHKRMDPIGFAFENYDAIGAWRDKDGGFADRPLGRPARRPDVPGAGRAEGDPPGQEGRCSAAA